VNHHRFALARFFSKLLGAFQRVHRFSTAGSNNRPGAANRMSYFPQLAGTEGRSQATAMLAGVGAMAVVAVAAVAVARSYSDLS
jgi:hypothetical protein